MSECTDAHNKLQSHLSKTMQEIYDQEKHISQLKKAIRYNQFFPIRCKLVPPATSVSHRQASKSINQIEIRRPMSLKVKDGYELIHPPSMYVQ